MYTIYELAWFFLIYSFLGWCAGVIANAIRKKKFVNTGFLQMPFCPVYGVGALGYSIFLTELRGNLFFLFLFSAMLGAFCCVVTGVLLEKIFHRKWWDYSKCRLQFEGYISIWHLLFFGAAGVVVVCLANPLLVRCLAVIPALVGNIVLIVAYSLLGIDFSVSIVALLQLKIRIHRVEQIAENMQKVTNQFGNALTGRIQKRMMKAYPNLEAKQIKEAEKPKEKKEVFAQGCCFFKLVWLFLIGAFLGDITETIFCRITTGEWMSRSSVVYGPFSIVWGLGCALFTGLLYKYKDCREGRVFVAGTVLGGAYEYICSVFTELVFGTVFWDYSALPFNLGGRINLLYCFFWGIAAVVWLKIIYPKLSALIAKIPIKWGGVLTWICIIFMVFDMGMSCLALARYNERQQETETSVPTEDAVEASAVVGQQDLSKLDVFLDKHFPDERMEWIYPNAIQVE